MKIITAIILFLCFSIPVSWSHLNSVSYSTITVKDEAIHVEFRYTLICTLELFQVDADSDSFLTKEELNPARDMIYYYLTNKIKVLCNGRQLQANLKNISFKVEEDDSYTIFDLVYPTHDKPKDLIILCNVSEEVDPYHRNLAEIKLGDKEYLYVFTNDNYFDSRNPPPIINQKANGVSSSTQSASDKENETETEKE